MFSNIFFLIIVLLLIGFLPDVEVASPSKSLIMGLAVYSLVILLIFVQNRICKTGKLLVLTNLELLAFLCFFYFVLGAHQAFPHSVTIVALASLLLYFFGLFIYHVSRGTHHALLEIGFLLPVAIPFLFIALLMDIEAFIPGLIVFPVLATLTFLILMTLFPVILQFFWQCQPIEDIALRNRLLAFCERLNFKHAGIKTWSVMKHALTAGVIGILPNFRYIMFTDRILKEMPEPCLEAILAHEIGHSKLKHLIMYPFIILGMSVAGAYGLLWIGDAITDPFLTFFIYIVIAAVYFRVVFGYFSRLFERQADLYVFKAGVPYYYMLQALDIIGTKCGNVHNLPSWHHYGIQERINFLCNAAIDRTLISRHDARVKWSIIAYFVILTLLTIHLLGD